VKSRRKGKAEEEGEKRKGGKKLHPVCATRIPSSKPRMRRHICRSSASEKQLLSSPNRHHVGLPEKKEVIESGVCEKKK